MISIKKGTRYGIVTVIKETKGHKQKCGGRKRYFKCKCDCGKNVKIRLDILRKGKLKSCGCLTPNIIKKSNTKHGKSRSTIYSKWFGLQARCNNKNNQNYGGRGIKCEWKTFEEFYKDMGKNYKIHLNKYGTKNTTIDRIDNNGNYSKNNCRWATCKQQSRNTRKNFLYKGKCLAERAEIVGLEDYIIINRKNKGWDIERAIFTPKLKNYGI